MNPANPAFQQPTTAEKMFNRGMGILVGLGMGPSYMYLLEVRGRKTGKLYSTPVDVLEIDRKRFLVAPRGRTQWVRNAEAAGEIMLIKRSKRERFRLRPLSGEEQLNVLKAYLDRFKSVVQRYFSVAAGSPPQAFAPVAENHPAFELTRD